MAEYKRRAISVVGPTASGKTELAVSLCERFNGEAVSCDSMQIYTGMPIATAMPSAAEMRGIPHHMLGFVSPNEVFSVAKYCDIAKEVISGIFERGKTPVIVGGTGLYYTSLIDNVSFVEEKTDFEYREMLKKRAEAEGAQALLEELRAVDYQAAESLHVNNLGRIIRALEIYHTTGITKTEQEQRSRSIPASFETVAVGLDAKNRDYLYGRINSRVDAMLSAGIIDEARAFYRDFGGKTAAAAIGFKELKPYLNGEEPLADSAERLKMQTRRYAKRQLTWFRRDERINWLYIDEYGSSRELADAAEKIIRGRGFDE